MPSSIIFKLFKTYKHPYLYDRHTNSLAMLTDEEFEELKAVQAGKISPEQSAAVQRYQQYGLLMPNVVEKIEHPGTQIIEQYLDTRLNQLTLQVTQQCNLRCAYCAYSGLYAGNRTHSSLRMSWDIAKRAIDFFLHRNPELAEVVIGFYGGEPLLEFGLIKKCVEYVKNSIEGKKVRFNMTTNGTLLTDEVVDFLVENDFALSVSLDGSEQEHDANRKFADGRGSFSTIIKNIERIKERYPEFDKKIMIMTTINPHSDLGCVMEYFSTDKVFNDKYIMFNPMKENNLLQEMTYDQRYYRIRNYEYIKQLFVLIGKLEQEYVSQLSRGLQQKIEDKYTMLQNKIETMPITHHSGPCMPGVQRLFVRVDGTLYPCERVNEDVDLFKIGTLDTGFDLKKIKALLNIGQISESECKNCWGINQCSVCAGELEFTGELTKQAKLKSCPKNCNTILFDLYEICVLSEFGFIPEEEKYN